MGHGSTVYYRVVCWSLKGCLHDGCDYAWNRSICKRHCTVRNRRQDGVYCCVSNMLGPLGYLIDDAVVGTAVALACVVIGYLVWRRLWKHREQRRLYRERGRQRQQYWGWE